MTYIYLSRFFETGSTQFLMLLTRHFLKRSFKFQNSTNSQFFLNCGKEIKIQTSLRNELIILNNK